MLLSCKTISRSLVRWAVKTGQVATALWSDEATNVIARLLELDDKVETSNVGKLVWFDAARRCAAEAASEEIRAWELRMCGPAQEHRYSRTTGKVETNQNSGRQQKRTVR